MADLADRDAGDRLVEDAWNVWGGLDAWLHFAGADILTGPARSFDFDAKLDLLLAVDVVSTLRLCRVVGRRMKDQGGGTIVTMGWDQAETGMEGDSGELFAATKGAVLAFTRSLALESRAGGARQCDRARLDSHRLGRDRAESLAGSGVTRNAAGTLGYADGHRRRRPLPHRPRRGLRNRASPPRQWGGHPLSDSSPSTIMFVTGRLAEPALRQMLSELAPARGSRRRSPSCRFPSRR